ncbi:flavodoxin family protein [Candidatus Omnitrophota bacterium]
MKIAVVYYSYSGKTHQAAEIIVELLQAQGKTVQCLRIEAPQESKNFAIQAKRALFKQKVAIEPIQSDLSVYDLMILGSPVWAREMVPAVRSYLQSVSGLDGKKVIIFVTYASGFGKEHCLRSMEAALEKKGAGQISRFSISDQRVSHKQSIETLLNEHLKN